MSTASHRDAAAASGGRADSTAADVPSSGRPGVARTRTSACVALSVSVGAYLALMLAVALVPSQLAHPLVRGGTLSVGLLFGVLVIVMCILMSALYTSLRNRSRGE